MSKEFLFELIWDHRSMYVCTVFIFVCVCVNWSKTNSISLYVVINKEF